MAATPSQGKLFLVVILGIALFSSLFTVREGQGGLVLRLGELKTAANGDVVSYAPGLHVKLPLLESVKRFDTRLQSFNVNASRVLTSEQKYVLVDYFVKWRIEDLSLFYKRTSGSKRKAEILLQQRTNGAIRAAFGNRTITEVISGQRVNIMALLREKANLTAQKLGINVVDVRIKGIDLPTEVSNSVFDRMSAERERVATKHRSNGRSAAEAIRAEADARVMVVLATAKAEAAAIRARGEAEAADTYNQAYGKDKAFSDLWLGLQAYAKTFNNTDDLVVLSPRTHFFNAFQRGNS